MRLTNGNKAWQLSCGCLSTLTRWGVEVHTAPDGYWLAASPSVLLGLFDSAVIGAAWQHGREIRHLAEMTAGPASATLS